MPSELENNSKLKNCDVEKSSENLEILQNQHNKLIVEHISKSFKAQKVVKDISLEINKGEIVGVLGPNGAGKTTAFYMIVGLIKADSGKISLNGKDVSKMPLHTRAKFGIGYLPQDESIFRKLTVEHNIMAILELNAKLNKSEIKARTTQLLQEFGIERLRKSQAQALSGGEKRRLEIARCLASDPEFILLDEPFAGVDPISISDIMESVRSLKSKNFGILITDHNVRETLAICDRAYIVSAGEIIAQGTAEQLLQNEKVKEVYLGKDFKI